MSAEDEAARYLEIARPEAEKLLAHLAATRGISPGPEETVEADEYIILGMILSCATALFIANTRTPDGAMFATDAIINQFFRATMSEIEFINENS